VADPLTEAEIDALRARVKAGGMIHASHLECLLASLAEARSILEDARDNLGMAHSVMGGRVPPALLRILAYLRHGDAPEKQAR